MADELFYHWSPMDRRKRILRLGLTTNCISRDGCWRPPYVCLAPYPQLAWNLSGGMSALVNFWDLWQVDVREQTGYEEIYFDNGNLKEIRVYERIYKRNVWYVGTR